MIVRCCFALHCPVVLHAHNTVYSTLRGGSFKTRQNMNAHTSNHCTLSIAPIIRCTSLYDEPTQKTSKIGAMMVTVVTGTAHDHKIAVTAISVHSITMRRLLCSFVGVNSIPASCVHSNRRLCFQIIYNGRRNANANAASGEAADD